MDKDTYLILHASHATEIVNSSLLACRAKDAAWVSVERNLCDGVKV